MKKSFYNLIANKQIESLLLLGFQAFNVVGVDQHRYRYVIHRLLKQRCLHPDLYHKDGVLINRNRLAQNLGVPNSKATQIIKHLLSWQVIDKIKHQKKGKSRTFRINSQFNADKVYYHVISFEESGFLKRLVTKSKMSQSLIDPLLQSQQEILSQMIRISSEGLDYLGCKYPSQFMKDLIESYRKLGPVNGTQYSDLFNTLEIDYSDLMLLSLLIGEFFVRRPDPESRIYSNLTSLKKQLRKYVLLNGEKMLMTDLINSQILFSVGVVKNYLRKKNKSSTFKLSKSFLRFESLAVSGHFYESLAIASGFELTSANRSQFKKQFFTEVFFSKVRCRGGPIKKAFRKLFIDVAKAINQLKKKHHADFAIELQRAEAKAFIDSTLRVLLEKGVPALTIHDSIIVSTQEHLDQAETILKNWMWTEYQLSPQFKRELA